MRTAVDDRASRRYVEDIIKLHDNLTVRKLRDSVVGEPVHVFEPGDGLLTLSVRESQLPDRYLRCLLGFRLAQYVRLGWISPEIVFRRALFHEELRSGPGGGSTHTVTLCAATGKVRGYVGLSGSADPAPRPLDDPDRARFPTEVAHDVDLLAARAAPGWTTHHVFEVKRFLRDRTMPAGARAARVPWHVVLGFGRTLLALGGEDFRVLVVGDAKERVAMRHLELMGLDLEVVHGTSPSLPRTDPNWPIYAQENLAKPFVGRTPPSYADDVRTIEEYLSRDATQESVRALIAVLWQRRHAPAEQRGAVR